MLICQVRVLYRTYKFRKKKIKNYCNKHFFLFFATYLYWKIKKIFFFEFSFSFNFQKIFLRTDSLIFFNIAIHISIIINQYYCYHYYQYIFLYFNLFLSSLSPALTLNFKTYSFLFSNFLFNINYFYFFSSFLYRFLL